MLPELPAAKAAAADAPVADTDTPLMQQAGSRVDRLNGLKQRQAARMQVRALRPLAGCLTATQPGQCLGIFLHSL